MCLSEYFFFRLRSQAETFCFMFYLITLLTITWTVLESLWWVFCEQLILKYSSSSLKSTSVSLFDYILSLSFVYKIIEIIPEFWLIQLNLLLSWRLNFCISFWCTDSQYCIAMHLKCNTCWPFQKLISLYMVDLIFVSDQT